MLHSLECMFVQVVQRFAYSFIAKFAVFYQTVVCGQRSRYLLHPFSYWRTTKQ